LNEAADGHNSGHHFTNNRKESSALPAIVVVQPQFKLSASAVRRMQHNLCSKHQS